MEEDTGHENRKVVTEKVVTEKKPLEYGLKYIEFVGNFVILFFMLTFISIYWCIGLVYMYFYTQLEIIVPMSFLNIQVDSKILFYFQPKSWFTDDGDK